LIKDAKKKEVDDLALTSAAKKASDRADKEWTQADLHLKRAKADLIPLNAPAMMNADAITFAKAAWAKLNKSNVA
jgi:hypothetical protein